MTTSHPQTSHDGSLSHRQIRTILAGLMAAMFMAALNQTVVVTAVRTIADDLQGLQHQAWAMTAYMITATISTPLYGKLSDIYGRKPFFLAAISIFMLGALLCTFVVSMEQLALFRAVQGLGAGGLMSLSLAILGDIVPARQRAKYQGYFLAVFGVASVLGPLFGGFFAGQDQILGITGWRWVFLFIVPFALAAMAVVTYTLNLTHHGVRQRIDWGGAVSLAVGLVPLLLVAELGRDWGWTSPAALVCYGLGVLGLVTFAYNTRRMKDEALVPPSLLKVPAVAIGSVGSVIVGVGMFVGLATLPLYLQIVRGATPTEAGLLMVPMTVGMMVGSVLSGHLISRTGRYRIFPVIGSAVMCAALVALGLTTVQTPMTVAIALITVLGLGLGNCMQPVTLAIQNAARADQMGAATSTATFTRQIGGTIGTAAFLSLLFTRAPGLISDALARHGEDAAFQAALEDPANASIAHDLATEPEQVLEAVQDDSSFLIDLDPVLARPFLEGFAESMQVVFLAGAAVMAVAFVVLWMLPELPLRTRSAYAERQEAAQAARQEASQDEAARTPHAAAEHGGSNGDGSARLRSTDDDRSSPSPQGAAAPARRRGAAPSPVRDDPRPPTAE